MAQKKWNCTLFRKTLYPISKNSHQSTITYDTLVRAGVDTTSAFVPDLLSASGAESGTSPFAVKGSRGIYIVPDIYFELSLCGPVSPILSPFSIPLLIQPALKDKHDLLVIPGGAQGADTISKHPSVQELVRRYIERGKLVGMICAGVSKIFSFIYMFSLGMIVIAGSLTALTAKLPSQPLTSHPSVRSLLEKGKKFKTLVAFN